jgi:hypothetical protein
MKSENLAKWEIKKHPVSLAGHSSVGRCADAKRLAILEWELVAQ